MSGAATPRRMSVAEYLEWERAQSEKHEYHLGEIFAMAGGSPRHNFLSNAVGADLRARGRLTAHRLTHVGDFSPRSPRSAAPGAV
jgi:Uma2 family endonuclease